MQVQINVANGKATLTSCAPVFIGATGPSGLTGYFDPRGTSLDSFQCAPPRPTTGTLVFDQRFPQKRTADSAVFFQYFWKKGLLRVEPGLDQARLKREFYIDKRFGLMHFVRNGRAPVGMYCTAAYGDMQACSATLVDTIDLLLFLEGKITSQELEIRTEAKK